MASNAQSGLLQMLGPTQNMSIYRKRNGEYGLRRKGGPTANRFAKDPNYEQARINTGEFGQAAKGSALIRRAFRAMIPKLANDELHNRLTKVCKEVINSDSDHPRGSRMLMNGDLSLLKDFNFNPEARFGLLVRIPFQHTVDRAAGAVHVGMPDFAPADMIRFPKHATHARLKLGVALLDFEEETFTFVSVSSDPIPKGRKPIKLDDLTAQIPSGSGDPLFVAMAIEFMTLEKGSFIPVLNCQFNGMQLMGVDVAAAVAQQSLPQQEALIVVETIVDTPIVISTVPLLETRIENQHSEMGYDDNLSENRIVDEMLLLPETHAKSLGKPLMGDTLQPPGTSVCGNICQLLDNHTHHDLSSNLVPEAETVEQQPDEQLASRDTQSLRYQVSVYDSLRPGPNCYHDGSSSIHTSVAKRLSVTRILKNNRTRTPNRSGNFLSASFPPKSKLKRLLRHVN